MQMYTPFHSKYHAYELTRKYSSHQLEKLSQSILSASVDLNPHQIDAALFAFRSPLSRGAILADEVGLGKTIEAALIISQLWAENKRKILCITPAALRKQWAEELRDKFFIESVILESVNYKAFDNEGTANPFYQQNKVVICSYQFARSKASAVGGVNWDIVVIDEAHRLRNVYKKDNKIARAIKDAIGTRPKVLLTATPLQNSMMELYGLISFIDPHIFGDEESFRTQFSGKPADMRDTDFSAIKARISPVCKRTLRRQVLEYIQYTNRISLTEDFTPTNEELELYDKVSAYLQKPSHALPSGQRALLTLVIRKILASSSFAISDTLGTMIERLQLKLKAVDSSGIYTQPLDLSTDYESAPVIDDELKEANPDTSSEYETLDEHKKSFLVRDIAAEIEELKSYKNLAQDIIVNAKGNALLHALKTGLAKAEELGAPGKALIFTESRRTQRYLKEMLESKGYAGHIVTLAGTNTDADSKAIYKTWLERHENEDCATGSYNVDIRSAIVEEFRDCKPIMIATESGAEGLNLQFCNLVVNYDLPWNPQRIEQRIGRCHRYGQKHDVVVINFINRKNEADQRVFDILNAKLKLFDGVFGASDEILGALGSGIDFEKRIHDIYQSCRTSAEIKAAFDLLEAELKQQIDTQMADTRAKLLENFDEDVHAKLRLSKTQTEIQLDKFSKCLWLLTRQELDGYADFCEEDCSFALNAMPPQPSVEPPVVYDLPANTIAQPSPAVVAGEAKQSIPLGRYQFITQKAESPCHHYRIGNPLADALIKTAKSRTPDTQEVVFDYARYGKQVTPIAELAGQKGWLKLWLVTINALETEEHLLFTAVTDSGTELSQETCEKFFNLPAKMNAAAKADAAMEAKMQSLLEAKKAQVISDISRRNQEYFDAELDKLESWSEDLKDNLERELKELDKEIKLTKKDARQTTDLDAKIALHKKASDMDRRRNEKRRTLFDEQDKIDNKKDTLISGLESQLKQQISTAEVFMISWRIE